MSLGYWIVKGDKTSCGGVVLDGHPDYKVGPNQLKVAVAGSPVSCGKHPGTYCVSGEHPGDVVNGLFAASTLYSQSTCPCKALFIPSQTWMQHGAWQEPRAAAKSLAAKNSEPEQHAQAARKQAVGETRPQADGQPRRTKREITLTLGVFFDGTANNAVNTANMIKAYTARHFDLSDPEAESILSKCAREDFGISGVHASSYIGYYTNVHWLRTLYTRSFLPDSTEYQHALYIEGIGTETGKPDSVIGQGMGTADTGVIAKTDRAVTQLPSQISQAITNMTANLPDIELVIKNLQFDIFGFSRGAAAARHFANRIHGEDLAIINAIREGLADTAFSGAPAGKIRFIGIFDTVTAVGTPLNGLNPHSADTGEVNIVLRPGVAEKVFHITAEHECRFNFALNSVKPAWPELVLPGAHSDIGGGYLPIMMENLFLTRPLTDTVPIHQPGEQTRGYHQTQKILEAMDRYPAIAPILRTNTISIETWYDDRMPSDRYGGYQKRSYAAMTLRKRVVRNSWANVALRVMIDAAQEAGVMFDAIDPINPDLVMPAELESFCAKAITMGKAVRSGRTAPAFSQEETDLIASKYIHCSANWNAIVVDTSGLIHGGASPAEIVGFVNRPDENWRRTVYNMDGKKI